MGQTSCFFPLFSLPGGTEEVHRKRFVVVVVAVVVVFVVVVVNVFFVLFSPTQVPTHTHRGCGLGDGGCGVGGHSRQGGG